MQRVWAASLVWMHAALSRVVTAAAEQQLVAQYRAGASLRRLSRDYHLGVDEVCRVLDAQQIRHDPRAVGDRKRLLTPAQEQEVARLHQAGWRSTQLAQRFGCTAMTIWRTVRRCAGPPHDLGSSRC